MTFLTASMLRECYRHGVRCLWLGISEAEPRFEARTAAELVGWGIARVIWEVIADAGGRSSSCCTENGPVGGVSGLLPTSAPGTYTIMAQVAAYTTPAAREHNHLARRTPPLPAISGGGGCGWRLASHAVGRRHRVGKDCWLWPVQ